NDDQQGIQNIKKYNVILRELSNRFEKGIKPKRIKEAGVSASELLVQVANGKVAEGTAEVDKLDRSEHTVAMNDKEINRRLGTTITITEMERILEKLRFNYSRIEDDFTVTIPTRRGDVVIFEDML